MSDKPLQKLKYGKRAISIRLDIVVLDFFRKSGPRWQSRINDVLKNFVDDNKGKKRGR